MDIEITGTMAPVKIGATGTAEIVQNVKTILSTIKGTVPLDREFGISGEYVDKPLPLARALYAAEVVGQVDKQEPRVKVSRVTFKDDAMDGRLMPTVSIIIKDGY